MKRYLIIILFLNILYSDIQRLNSSNRIRYDFMNYDNNTLEVNNFRDEDELLDFIQSTFESNLIPGLSIAVVKNNNIVWEKQFGFANIDADILVDENTMFILSSISKTVTATALMMLHEQNLFMLDDDIDNYLPFNVNHPDYPLTPITFKMLLSHTSGIKDNWNVMPYYDGDSQIELNNYLSQYLIPGGELYNDNSNFTNSMPGTSYNYSNIGAALIGLLVEEISNQPFNQFCNDLIFFRIPVINMAPWIHA